MREIGRDTGVPSYLIDDANGLKETWFEGVTTVGITAGASAPEELVLELIHRLGDFGEVSVHEAAGVDENMQFKLPRELLDEGETPSVGAAAE